MRGVRLDVQIYPRAPGLQGRRKPPRIVQQDFILSNQNKRRPGGWRSAKQRRQSRIIQRQIPPDLSNRLPHPRDGQQRIGQRVVLDRRARQRHIQPGRQQDQTANRNPAPCQIIGMNSFRLR